MEAACRRIASANCAEDARGGYEARSTYLWYSCCSPLQIVHPIRSSQSSARRRATRRATLSLTNNTTRDSRGANCERVMRVRSCRRLPRDWLVADEVRTTRDPPSEPFTRGQGTRGRGTLPLPPPPPPIYCMYVKYVTQSLLAIMIFWTIVLYRDEGWKILKK